MSPDARAIVDEHCGGVADAADPLHDLLHARLGAATRALRGVRGPSALHAAVVRLADGRGLLLPGPSRSGKSTLALLLARRSGASIVGDDLCWLRRGEATAFGAPVTVRRENPAWKEARALWYADDSERLLVRPVDVGGGALLTSSRADVVVFPRYEPAGPARMVELSPADVLCRLVSATKWHCPPEMVGELASVAGRVVAAELHAPDGDESWRLTEEVLRSAPRRHPDRARDVDRDDLERSGLRTDVVGIRFGGDVVLLRCRPRHGAEAAALGRRGRSPARHSSTTSVGSGSSPQTDPLDDRAHHPARRTPPGGPVRGARLERGECHLAGARTSSRHGCGGPVDARVLPDSDDGRRAHCRSGRDRRPRAVRGAIGRRRLRRHPVPFRPSRRPTATTAGRRTRPTRSQRPLDCARRSASGKRTRSTSTSGRSRSGSSPSRRPHGPTSPSSSPRRCARSGAGGRPHRAAGRRISGSDGRLDRLRVGRDRAPPVVVRGRRRSGDGLPPARWCARRSRRPTSPCDCVRS